MRLCCVVDCGMGQGRLFLKTLYMRLKAMCCQLFFFFFQSHQKWHQEGGKIEVQFIKQAAETFLGHGRCFCLGAKMFSYEITKQHHRLLGDFVLLVI